NIKIKKSELGNKMIRQVELEGVINNKYRIFSYENNLYLFNIRMWYILCPLLLYVLPQKVYKIKESRAEFTKVKNTKLKVSSFILGGVSLFIARILEKTFLNNKILGYETIKTIALCFIFLTLIGII